MNPIGARVLARWDSSPEHDGLTAAMLDRAVTLGWITADDRDARRASAV